MHFVTPSKQLHFTSFGGRCKERLDSASPGYVKWDVSALGYYLYAQYQRWAQTLKMELAPEWTPGSISARSCTCRQLCFYATKQPPSCDTELEAVGTHSLISGSKT